MHHMLEARRLNFFYRLVSLNLKWHIAETNGFQVCIKFQFTYILPNGRYLLTQQVFRFVSKQVGISMSILLHKNPKFNLRGTYPPKLLKT